MNYTRYYLRKNNVTNRSLAALWNLTEIQVCRMLKEPWKISIGRWIQVYDECLTMDIVSLQQYIKKDINNGSSKIQ